MGRAEAGEHWQPLVLFSAFPVLGAASHHTSLKGAGRKPSKMHCVFRTPCLSLTPFWNWKLYFSGIWQREALDLSGCFPIYHAVQATDANHPHCVSNVCNGILCTSGLWAGFQGCNSRGIASTSQLPNCRAECRCQVTRKWSGLLAPPTSCGPYSSRGANARSAWKAGWGDDVVRCWQLVAFGCQASLWSNLSTWGNQELWVLCFGL